MKAETLSREALTYVCVWRRKIGCILCNSVIVHTAQRKYSRSELDVWWGNVVSH